METTTTTESMKTEKTTERLERETCTRCGGSGHYSYCQRYGTTCFKCGGKGRTLSKRGAAAMAYLRSLLEVRADSLKVGDVIQVGGVTGSGEVYEYFARIVEIAPTKSRAWAILPDGTKVEHDYSKHVDISTEHPKFGGSGLGAVAPDTMIRKSFSAAEKAPMIEKAVAYQATLTKAGKPRKA